MELRGFDRGDAAPAYSYWSDEAFQRNLASVYLVSLPLFSFRFPADFSEIRPAIALIDTAIHRLLQRGGLVLSSSIADFFRRADSSSIQSDHRRLITTFAVMIVKVWEDVPSDRHLPTLVTQRFRYPAISNPQPEIDRPSLVSLRGLTSTV